ncbi:MAG: dTDP-4-dehydrorhamnose reductase [Mariprofundus sp.]|nr:dTDP-4-dehydrorhamnose reductase [Mariprofundus sp.]
MKLLITGAKGQLGSELVRLGSNHELLAVDHDGLDICNADAVNLLMNDFCPDVVVNAAAYTAVDRAESDRDAAFAVNRDGPANLAKACERVGIPLIHVSTDYVFDGSKIGSYVEDDPVCPLGVYGASKLAGEQAIQEHCSHHIILRTSWVFSAHGHNFVKTMLRLGSNKSELSVVADQHGCPTAAAELARGIYALMDSGLDDSVWGIYHFCQPDPATWYSFAESIFDAAARQGHDLKLNRLNAIVTSDYPTLAKRPANSALDCSKFESVFEVMIKPWRESLVEVVNELKAQ